MSDTERNHIELDELIGEIINQLEFKEIQI